MSHVVHERAVADLGCDDVQIEHVAGGTFEATGCGRSATYTCVTQAWSSGTCVHDDDPSQGSPATRTAAPVATGQTSSARHAPPASAGGFELGITDAQARAACETAGHVYATKAASSSCDGLPTEVGQPAEARLRFCASKLCRVTLVIQRPSETLEQSLVRWKRALVDKYGGQTATENQIPSDCKDLASCVAAHRATVSVEWTWPTGEGIALSVVNTNGDGGDNPDGVVVRVSYSKDAPNGL
jgi:hypothetical protein